jgi:lysozyme family protein
MLRLFYILGTVVMLVGCGKPAAETQGAKPGAVAVPSPAHPSGDSLPALKTPPSVKQSLSALQQMQLTRWNAAAVRKEKLHAVQATVAQIQRNQARYAAVEKKTGVPWQVIACIHNMECSLSFSLGLYCGDPLTARTRNEPRGLPTAAQAGNPPFQWELVAILALQYDKLDKKSWGEIYDALQAIEAYNGTGYEQYHKDVPTPYLWSWTTLYTKGKYIADGKWSSTAISAQCGVVPLLKVMPQK